MHTLQRILRTVTVCSALFLTGTTLAADGWLNTIDQANVRSHREPNVHLKLISAGKALTPQADNELAVVIEHEPGWHTYWLMPGEAGLTTTFDFKLPADMRASAPDFPLPERFLTSGLVTYGYGGTTLFPFRLDVLNRNALGSHVTLSVKASYLACKDVCVPGEASASLRLPVAVATDESADADAIEAARRLIPEKTASAPASAQIEDNRIRIRLAADAVKVRDSLTFLPLEAAPYNLRFAPLWHDGALYLEASPAFAKAPAKTLKGVLVADGGPSKGGWAIATDIALTSGAVEPIEAAHAPTIVETAPQAGVSITALSAILFAFAGGLILNLMPCVFPVLSMKLLQLVEGARRGENLPAHGSAFTLGVLVTMIALAGVLLALRGAGFALGWGFQLQSPVVVSLLVLLFTAITLNFAGVFEFSLGNWDASRLGDKAARQSGAVGSFFTGMLAVIVASPCTAPFMGAALGYALTQPVLESLAVFAALGLGMAAPWLLICLLPSWARHLPKPGPWMNTFRRVMAAPMALALLWLVWVLSRQISATGLVVMLCADAAFAVMLWLVGREQWGKGRNRTLRLVMGVLALAGVAVMGTKLVAPAVVPQAAAQGALWQTWSPQAVQTALAQKRPVFVDFTAAWCVTCQANKIAILDTAAMRDAFERMNYVTLEGDWTNRDERITEILRQFNRSGVPLYLIYSPDGRIEVLPELLTKSLVLEALRRNAS